MNKANRIPDFINQLDLDLEVKNKLSFLNKRIVDGSSDVYRTPIGKDLPVETIVKRLDNLFDANKTKINSTLNELEQNNKSKIGPRSIALPWRDRKHFLYSSFEKDMSGNFKITRPKDSKQLRPLSLANAMKLLKNNTNSGLPYFTRKSVVKQRTLENFDKLIAAKYPCILFTRTQEGMKTRDVWGYPMADTLNEMRFYAPLLEYQRELSYRSALLGPDQVSKSVTELIDFAIANDKYIMSVDFSSYDTTVKAKLQKLAFDYVKFLFQTQHDKEIDDIANRFNDIGILTPDGVIKGSHGVPSGSTFTNEVDSIVQYIISTNSGFVDNRYIQIQGDDGLYVVDKDNVTKLSEFYKYLALLLNIDKSYTVKDYCVYLQNLYHIDYRKNGVINGIYPLYRAINRILFQERWSQFEDFEITGKDYYSLRTISILENCKHHPLFEDFVKLILEIDKYSLDYTSQGLNKYIKFIYDTKGAGDVIVNQYGDDVKGIQSFETVKLINRLR